MSLQQYNDKRDFTKTAEPSGKETSIKNSLRFVVQKHDASSVHYDFRLEMDGVLKSWAVPKGPSLNPADKRLAMRVEDHPYSYRNFEGIIPAGEYGGGTVIVWDEGTYEPAVASNKSKKAQEKILLDELAAGKLNIVLHGKKLRGAYTLLHMKAKGEKPWMLIKKKDEFASAADITSEEASVKSGHTLTQVATAAGVVLNHPPIEKQVFKKQRMALSDAGPKVEVPSAHTQKKSRKEVTLYGVTTSVATKAPAPQDVVPMLATLTAAPFDDAAWLYEEKWDGYRAIAHCDKGKVELVSRNLKPFTGRYLPVADALKALCVNAVMDGEIIAVNNNGAADFQLLQNWQNHPVELQYHVFDLLWVDGYNVANLPLVERKKMLQNLLQQNNAVVKYSAHSEGDGIAAFAHAQDRHLEGIMAKRKDSIYQVGERSDAWLKIKTAMRQEVVIAGFTQPRNSRRYFGSLLLGVYQQKKLVYVGHTGSGFNATSLKEIYGKLQPLIITDAPFAEPPKTNMPATWVKPTLVCEIKFTEWTTIGMARHPIFMGLRSDKKATQVTIEKISAMPANHKTAALKKGASIKKEKASSNQTSTPEATKPGAVTNEERTVAGHTLQLTNLQKTYWKKEGFTKGDLLAYYQQVAPYMLPYLTDRPHSLHRHPAGADAPGFYQKEAGEGIPDWIKTYEDFSESTGKPVHYLVCKTEADLLYMANLGCIEINPWHSRTAAPLKPDWCLLDLDPDTGNTFNQVVEVANLIHRILNAAGAESCVKTSGSTGMHIYVPLGAKYGFEESKTLAETVVTMVNKELPTFTSLERTPAKRKGKIYLDFLQNKETQTAAAPYSLRPKPGVPASAPLHWSEVKKGLKADTFTAYNLLQRLKTEGDLFGAVLQKGIDLKAVLAKLKSST